ncbi:MAG: hypothetical protein IJ968_03480, partial [Clostridia bacterium]|nr:hypothetical protein [Clostridia bacterium]
GESFPFCDLKRFSVTLLGCVIGLLFVGKIPQALLDQHFILKDREKGVYRCMFCDAERKSKALR